MVCAQQCHAAQDVMGCKLLQSGCCGWRTIWFSLKPTSELLAGCSCT